MSLYHLIVHSKTVYIEKKADPKEGGIKNITADQTYQSIKPNGLTLLKTK